MEYIPNKSKIFSDKETQIINSKRADLDIETRQKSPSTNSFYRAIDFENSILNLALLRCQKVPDKEKQSSFWKDKISQKLISLYERMTKKHKGDLSAWLNYVVYLKNNDYVSSVSDTFAQILSLHPTKAKLWAAAAFWELDGRKNASAARKLLFKGEKYFERELSQKQNNEFSASFLRLSPYTLNKFAKMVDQTNDSNFEFLRRNLRKETELNKSELALEEKERRVFMLAIILLEIKSAMVLIREDKMGSGLSFDLMGVFQPTLFCILRAERDVGRRQVLSWLNDIISSNEVDREIEKLLKKVYVVISNR